MEKMNNQKFNLEAVSGVEDINDNTAELCSGGGWFEERNPSRYLLINPNN